MKAKKSAFERLAEDWPAKILSVAAAIGLFWFNRMGAMEQKFFSVPLKAAGAGRVLPAKEYPETVRVTLRGDADKLEFITPQDIEAYVDFSGVVSEGWQDLPVHVRRLGNALEADPLEISVDPVHVRLPFEARESRNVPVEPRFTGSPETGFEKASGQVSPATVEVSGPRSLVAKVQSVFTEPFSLSGLSADATAAVRLQAPSALIELSSAGAVELRLAIRQAFAKKTFDSVPIALIGLAPGLKAEGKLPGGTLTITGPKADLDSFSLEEGSLYMDLTSLNKAGSAILPVQASLPPELSVAELEPAELQVRISERD